MNNIKISEEVIEVLSKKLITHKLTLDGAISDCQSIIDDINRWDVNIQKDNIISNFIQVVERKANLADAVEIFEHNAKNNLHVLIEEDELISKKIGVNNE